MPHKEIAARHVAAMLEEAAAAGVPSDILGRTLLDHVVRIYRLTRSYDDIASELQFVAENIDPDTDFTFMRP
ncbi:hypothetical protein [Iodidimonas sp. SYSU 1G8]|uniref:hypothetical protein n=1 Tax=Iodidimonas sp. SYSU 1G8 TaxID=3133967 RepID=UPI0031FE605C